MEGLREKEDPGAFGHLIQILDQSQGEFRKLHHGTGHIAQQHQMFPAAALLFVVEPVEAATGFQTFPDGASEIQLAAVAASVPLGGKFTVDLPRDILDDVNGPGDLGVGEFRNIPVQQANLRVRGLTADGCLFHADLLLQ